MSNFEFKSGCEIFHGQNNSTQRLYRNANKGFFEQNLKALCNAGYSEYYNEEMNGNIFCGYEKDGHAVTVQYLPFANEVRLIEEPYVVIPYYPLPKEAICEPKMTQIGFDFRANFTGLDYHNSFNVKSKHACGMSFVFTLTDGSYIILDGGANCTDLCASTDHLYNYLKKNNKRKDGKIVIAAWLLTHFHTDHIRNFERLSILYGKEIEVKNFICNHYSIGGFMHYNRDVHTDGVALLNYIFETHYNEKPVIHTTRCGQKMQIGCVEIQTLFTHDQNCTVAEDGTLIDSKSMDGNIGSAVYMFTLKQDGAKDVKIAFPGDLYSEAVDTAIACCKDKLVCDMVQVPHHGYSNAGNRAFAAAMGGVEHILFTHHYYHWIDNPKIVGKGGAYDWFHDVCPDMKIYPQCDPDETQVDWHFTFEGGEIKVEKERVESKHTLL